VEFSSIQPSQVVGKFAGGVDDEHMIIVPRIITKVEHT